MGDKPLDMVSYLTILRPQGSLQSIEPMSEIGDYMLRMESETWQYKKHFFLTTLTYCLGLSNIWMFPKHALMHGNATFVYLYIIYSLLFGTSLLFFEVSLGQYANKGFAKIFTLCPIFEGLSISMGLYCLMKSMFYNILNVYSIYYLFASFHRKLPHSFYHNYSNTNSTDHRKEPETEFFYNEVLLDDDHSNYFINVENCAILFIVWGIIFIVLFLVSRRLIWVPLVTSSLVILTLLYTMVVALTLKGASSGVYAMFVPIKNDLASIQTWIHPFEQSFLTMGIGMGPLINLGSYSKFRTSTHVSCLLISFISLAVSLLSGVTFFGIAGSLAFENNVTIADLIDSRKYKENTQIHIIFSQFINKLTHNWSQFTSFLYFFVILLDGFFSVSIYTIVIIIWLKAFIPISRRTRLYLVLGVCLICYLLGSLLTCKHTPHFLFSLEKIFMGTSVLFITSCETLAVCYFYGLGNFCDDIEFMLGYVPSYFYQIIWLISPFFILLKFGMSVSIIRDKANNWYDYSAVLLMVILVICPIISFSFYNCYVAVFKLRHLSTILHPKVPDVLANVESTAELHENRRINQ